MGQLSAGTDTGNISGAGAVIFCEIIDISYYCK